MIPIEIQNVIRSLPARVLELRMLRGSTPWSLAGTDGTRREENILTRELLVSRIKTVVRPFGWSARLDTVRSEAGRTNKIELVLTGPSGESEVWTW